MIRYTTPTHRIVFGDDVNVEDFDWLYATYQQNGKTIIEKSLEDMTAQENYLEFSFTQEETAMFSPVFDVKFQIRAGINDLAVATKIYSFRVSDVLKEGVLE